MSVEEDEPGQLLRVMGAAERGTGFTMKDLTPEREALEDVCILLLVIVSEACATLAHLDREGALVVLGLRWVEVLLKVVNHPLAWIAIRAEERVVIPDAVYALPDFLLAEARARVLGGERLNRTLFALDVLLDVTARTAFGVNLFSRNRDEIVTEKVDGVVLLEDNVDALDGRNARKAQQVLDLCRLAILWSGLSQGGRHDNLVLAHLEDVNQLPVRRTHLVGVHNLVPPTELKDVLIEFLI